MSTSKQNSTAPMDVKTRKLKPLKILSRNPEGQQPVLNSSDIAAIILRFLQGLSENQWKEVNEGEYDKSVKKKLNEAIAEVLKLSANSLIKMFLKPNYIESLTGVCCCCTLRELAGDDINDMFERVFRRALQEIGGVDIHIKISQKLCYDVEICVIHKVSSALLLSTQASTDQAVIVDADHYMVEDYTMSKRTLVGAFSTMRSFLKGQVNTIRRNILKKEKSENKKARQDKKKMSLWKRCVLKMHNSRVKSIFSLGSIGYDDYYEPSSTTQTGEQQYPSHSLTHPTHDSHGCSLRAAADPEKEVYTSSSSSGALEESGSALKDTIIQVLPFEDPEEKERAKILRQPVFGITLKKEAPTEQPQISNEQSSDSDLEEETATLINYAQRRVERAWSPLPTDLDPFDTLARGDTSTTQTGEQQHPSHSLTHPTHRAAADPEKEVYTSEPAGSSSGALKESGSALKNTKIQVLPFEDPEEKERAEVRRQPVFGIRKKKEAPTEQPQILNRQRSYSELEVETAVSFYCPQRRVERAWSPLPTDLDPFDTLVHGDTSTTQTGEQQHPSHSLTHPTHDSHGPSLRAAADPEKEVYTSEPAGSSSGALKETGSALKDTKIQVLPFEDPEEKERAEILRQPVFGIRKKKEAPREQPQISNEQSSDSDLEDETATSINYTKRRVERAWSPLPTDLDPFYTLVHGDTSTTQTGEQQHPSHSLTHPTHDSHGCSLRAAADPEKEVYTSEPAGSSSGALEETGSALKDTTIQVLPLEDKEAKGRAQVRRQPVFGIRKKKEAPTEQQQISNRQSSYSELEVETAVSFYCPQRRVERAWSPLPTDLDPFDTSVHGDTSTTQTGEQQHPSHSLTHPTHDSHGCSLRAAADPEKEVYTSEPAGSSSGALEETGSALKDTIIQVLPFEDPEEKERAKILRQPVFGITLKKEAPTEQPQISNRQRSYSELEVETAVSFYCPQRCVERAWSPLPTDLDPFDTLVHGDTSTTQTGEQQHPSHSLTHPTHDSHGCSLRAAADPEKEVYTSEPAGSSSGALEETGSALRDTITQVLPFEDPEEKERAKILRQPVFGITLKKEAPTEQPQISNRQSSVLEEETATSINYAPKKIPFWKRFRLPFRSNRVHPVFTAGLNQFGTLARGDLSTTQTVEQQAASCSLTVSIPNTSNEHSRSNLQITTPTVQSFTAPKEDNMSTSLVLEHLVEGDTNQDKSDDDLLFTIVEPILIDQQIFKATEDSQEKMKTFPDRQSDNETSASENTDTTETQAKEKKGFFSSLRRFFKKDKKENESLEKKKKKKNKLCNWKMPFLCGPALPESL